MANSTLSPNMGLVLPTVGVDPGPDWATNLNASLSIVDSHNHSSGQGNQIQPNGLNINSDLTFLGNSAISLKTARFSAQSAPISNSGSNVGCLYVSGNEIYYNDVTGGHQVQITNAGSVNAGAGSITGLPSGTASASFSAGTFVWQSATSTAANMDMASAVLRNSSAGSHGLTLQAPNMAAGNTVITLPPVPLATSFMQLDTSGNMTGAVAVTGGITTTNIASATILQGNMAANSIGTSQIIDANVTQSKRVALGQQISTGVTSYNVPASSTAVPGLSVSLTTTGRPVWVGLQSNGTGGDVAVVSGALYIFIYRGAVQVSASKINMDNGVSTQIPASAVWFIDTPSAGTYAYTIQAQYVTLSSGNAAIENCKLIAFEL